MKALIVFALMHLVMFAWAAGSELAKAEDGGRSKRPALVFVALIISISAWMASLAIGLSEIPA